MSPKYMLVLLVALVLAAISLANHAGPILPPSLQQQHTPHLDNNVNPKPPHKRRPPHGAPTNNELSLQEQQNTKKTPDPGHGGGVEPNNHPRKPPIKPPPNTN
ncbi:hypothetical protein E2542_SST04617 [Spatholobus suberectus]|nr:hypothetical protein E2542_SST04617 [Spatholobus suberectus]